VVLIPTLVRRPLYLAVFWLTYCGSVVVDLCVRYLPEGLQQVTLHGEQHVAGVYVSPFPNSAASLYATAPLCAAVPLYAAILCFQMLLCADVPLNLCAPPLLLPPTPVSSLQCRVYRCRPPLAMSLSVHSTCPLAPPSPLVCILNLQIQLGRKARTGELWFHNLESGVTTEVTLDMPGRPGFFRPTSRENTFLVGMETEIGYVTIATGASTGKYTRLAALPPGLPESVMVNDGCVAPNGDVIIGTKDFNFDTKACLAGTWRYRPATGQVDQLFGSEVCANGNCFLEIDGRTHLVHVDTGPKAMYALPYDLQTGVVGERWTLFAFSKREPFDMYVSLSLQLTLLPGPTLVLTLTYPHSPPPISMRLSSSPIHSHVLSPRSSFPHLTHHLFFHLHLPLSTFVHLCPPLSTFVHLRPAHPIHLRPLSSTLIHLIHSNFPLSVPIFPSTPIYPCPSYPLHSPSSTLHQHTPPIPPSSPT